MVLDVKGYDLILGMDWLSSLGPMFVDWGKGSVKMMSKGKPVCLEVERVSAEVRVCEQVTEVTKGSTQLLVAQLFLIEEGERGQEKFINPILQPVLKEYQDLFSEPTSLPPKREIDKIIDELLRNSFIQPSQSPYSSPILLVKKKDNTWRMCVDYRRLNRDTIRNQDPIPIIDDLLDELKGARLFTKLDLRSGYHQRRMNEEDIAKTAFHTHEGLYELKVK